MHLYSSVQLWIAMHIKISLFETEISQGHRISELRVRLYPKEFLFHSCGHVGVSGKSAVPTVSHPEF